MGTVIIISTLLTTATAFPYQDDSNEYESGAFGEERGTKLKFGNSLARATTLSKPIVPLEFWEKVKKKPHGRQLKESKLLEKMGSDFDPDWMSVRRPDGGAKGAGPILSLSEQQVADLMEELDQLDLEHDIRGMVGAKQHEPTMARALGAFQQWLVKKSSCPVHFEWEDLGEYFWPRWVRTGSCSQKSHHTTTASCSWPGGLTCGPADAEVVQLLRWHCRRRPTPDLLGLTTRQRIRKSYKCRWIKVPYPVTSSCKCA